MKFRVIDLNTKTEADPAKIALTEEWAKGLVYCDMEGFAMTQFGELLLVDVCGNCAYCPEGRFKVKPLPEMGDETKVILSYKGQDKPHPICELCLESSPIGLIEMIYADSTAVNKKMLCPNCWESENNKKFMKEGRDGY